MNSVDCLQPTASQSLCGSVSGFARRPPSPKQQQLVQRPCWQPTRVQCGANTLHRACKPQCSRDGPLLAYSRSGQPAGIKPGAARQTAVAVGASADFAPDDFRSADMVADGSTPVAPLTPASAAAAVQSKGLTGLAARVVFGTLLGAAGALVILTGGWCYMISACFVAYQASKEYFGFLTSKVPLALHSRPDVAVLLTAKLPRTACMQFTCAPAQPLLSSAGCRASLPACSRLRRWRRRSRACAALAWWCGPSCPRASPRRRFPSRPCWCCRCSC